MRIDMLKWLYTISGNAKAFVWGHFMDWGRSACKNILTSTGIVLTVGIWTAIYSADCYLQ